MCMLEEVLHSYWLFTSMRETSYNVYQNLELIFRLFPLMLNEGILILTMEDVLSF